jgi:hypothetical protein
MKQQIIKLRNMFKSGIDLALFSALTLNSTNGTGYLPGNAYSNNKTIDEWVTLYVEYRIKPTEEQLRSYFDYMINYHGEYFGKNQGKYYVTREFSLIRERVSFDFETAIFTAFEVMIEV